MEQSKDKSCNFFSFFCVGCDIYNIILGFLLAILIPTPGVGFIILHAASILYLCVHEKLGFEYHLPTTRILMIFPDILFTYYASLAGTDTWIGFERWITGCSIILGLILSIFCAFSSIISYHYKCLCVCASRSDDVVPSPGTKSDGKDSIFSTRIYLCLTLDVASLKKNDQNMGRVENEYCPPEPSCPIYEAV